MLSLHYPELFFEAAALHIAVTADSGGPGFRFLATLLLRQEWFFEKLTDPRLFTLDKAVRFFKNLLSVDATLDFRLARMLPGKTDSPGRVLRGANAARAIDILDRTSHGPKVVSILGHLPESNDPKLSAKAALFVGKRTENTAWAEKLMGSSDPRLRANVLEGAWGKTSEDAVRIMEDSLDDTDNRVAGNALIGLHLAGSPEVADRALEMSRSADPALRSTAAWAMGKIGDSEFVSRLTELMKDPAHAVRSTAVRSLVEIGRVESRKAAERAAQAKAAPPVPEAPTAQPQTPPEPQIEFNLRLDGSYSGVRVSKRIPS